MWLIHYMKEDRLPTPKPGNQTDQSELTIYINELEALTKESGEKLQNLTQIADKTETASEEEKQARTGLSNYVTESEEAHGPLTDKLTALDKTYTILADLELELFDIRKREI